MKRLMILVSVAAILAVLGSSVGAFTMAQKIVVAGQLVAVPRVSAGGFTAQQRANQVNDRLAYILGYERLCPRDINAKLAPGDSRAIMVGNKLLITVTPRDARANKTTVGKLTDEWLKRARSALPQARPTICTVG